MTNATHARLFAIRKPNGEVMGKLYFANKQDAKAYRDELNNSPGNRGQYTVTRGPDHWRQIGL